MRVGFMLLSLSLVVNEFAEIQLRFSRRMSQRQKAVGLVEPRLCTFRGPFMHFYFTVNSEVK